MTHFTPLVSLVGGVLIGVSAALLLLLNGRVAGITGIFAGLLTPTRGEIAWRLAFVGGLLAGGILMLRLRPETFANGLPRHTATLVAAGLLVGFGTRLANGCTSGHGVCGISRFSKRSIVATVTFIATGVATAFVITRFFGGVA